MAIIAQIPWTNGNGYIVVETVANKPNTFAISSSTANDDIIREQTITFQTTNTKGLKASVKLNVKQLGYRELFITANDAVFTSSDSTKFKILKEQK